MWKVYLSEFVPGRNTCIAAQQRKYTPRAAPRPLRKTTEIIKRQGSSPFTIEGPIENFFVFLKCVPCHSKNSRCAQSQTKENIERQCSSQFTIEGPVENNFFFFKCVPCHSYASKLTVCTKPKKEIIKRQCSSQFTIEDPVENTFCDKMCAVPLTLFKTHGVHRAKKTNYQTSVL